MAKNVAAEASGSCVLHSLTALSVVTCAALLMVMGLHVAELVKFHFNGVRGRQLELYIKVFALHIFGILFCFLGIAVEAKVRWFAASESLSIFQNFMWRGLFYVYIGISAQSVITAYENSQTFATCMDIATWMTVGFGVVYALGELLCVRTMAIKRMQKGKKEVPLV